MPEPRSSAPVSEARDEPRTATNPVDTVPASSATPLLDAAIRRVADVSRQQRESLEITPPPASLPDVSATLIPSGSPLGDRVASRSITDQPDVSIGLKRIVPDDSELLPQTLASAKKPVDAEGAPFAAPGHDLQSPSGLEQGHLPVRQEPVVDSALRRSDLALPPAPAASPSELSTPKEGDKTAEAPEPVKTKGPGDVEAPVSKDENPAAMGISELRLCRKVLGFGSFEPLDERTVKAGQRLLIYCEMTGLHYETKDTAFVSRIASRIEISAAGGGPVQWQHELGAGEDICRRRRHDYYVTYRVDLPQSIAAGSYRLRLFQTDLVANCSTSAEIPLEVIP